MTTLVDLTSALDRGAGVRVTHAPVHRGTWRTQRVALVAKITRGRLTAEEPEL